MRLFEHDVRLFEHRISMLYLLCTAKKNLSSLHKHMLDELVAAAL